MSIHILYTFLFSFTFDTDVENSLAIKSFKIGDNLLYSCGFYVWLKGDIEMGN